MQGSLQEPMIPQTSGDDSGIPTANGASQVKEVPLLATYPAEITRVLGLALPIGASEILSFTAYLVTTSMVGQLGAAALSSFTLARTVFHITGLSLVVGLTSGQDTFSGQAFGAGQHRMVGVYLQRAVLIGSISALLSVAMWWGAAAPLMAALGQDPALILQAADVLRWMAPSLLIWTLQNCMQNYFKSQGVVTPLVILATLGIGFTAATNYVFIYKLGLGLRGAAMAYNVQALTEALALMGCMVWLHAQQPAGSKTWCGVDLKAATQAWGSYLHIAVPSAVMICLDWWTFEVMVLIAGLQPNAEVQLAAMGILFATHALAYMLASGFGIAAATRTSNELGAGNGLAAQRATQVCLLLAVAVEVTASAALVMGAQPWASMYSSDAEVVKVVAGAMPFAAMSVASDSVNTVLSGALRGCGLQWIGLLVNLGTFWLIGIPLAAYLDLCRGQGAIGVWGALGGVSLLQALVLMLAFSFFKWGKLARRAQELLASGHGGLDTSITHHGIYEPLLVGAAV